MQRWYRFFEKHLNLLLALGLSGASLYAWVVWWSPVPPYEVEPIRAPEVVVLLDHIREGGHSGETWEVTLTELQAEQTITWYLKRYPQIPFAHPRVEIAPDYLAGEGDATIAGLRVHVGGRVRITLVDELPQVQILELSLPLPGPVRQALEDEIRVQLRRAAALPVRFTSAEWSDGKVVVRGYIR